MDWISVDVMMPPEDKPLIITDGELIFIGEYYKGEFKMYDKDTGCEKYITDFVEFWIEIPELPFKYHIYNS